MKKIVINKCYGGFGLSKEGIKMLAALGVAEAVEALENGGDYLREIPRDNKFLVEIVEKFPDIVSGNYAELKVVSIPINVKWQIEEYDGNETVAEVHRTWG